MAKASNNQFPSVLFTEGAVPAGPAAGDQRIYIDVADHKLKRVDDSDAVVDIEAPQVSAINIVIDGGGSAIAVGIVCDVEIPWACEISRCTLLADQAAAAVIDLWVEDYANFPPTDADSITAAAPPTLAAAKAQDSTLTDWIVAMAAGDILRVNVDSNDVAERITLSLLVTRT